MRHSSYLPGRVLRSTYLAGLEFAPILAATTTQTIAVTDSADPVITGGDAFSYAVQYTNTGSVNAVNVTVQVTLDASLTYVSATGTGWSISQSGGVVTATATTLAPGAANVITINVTTGNSALTATTSAQATAGNAVTATGSQTTTVQLITKDATSGIYTPASNTEWTNFIARKGLTISAPTNIYNCQEASGNLVDANGTNSLTASGTITYQSAISGWSRKGVKFTDDNTTGQAVSTTTPTLASNSFFRLALVLPGLPASATKNMWLQGTAAFIAAQVTTTGVINFGDNGGTVNTTNTYGSTVAMIGQLFDRTNSRHMGYTQLEKVTGTFNGSPTGQKSLIGVGANNNGPETFGYCVDWWGSTAVMTDAQVKALYQALGYTITWS